MQENTKELTDTQPESEEYMIQFVQSIILFNNQLTNPFNESMAAALNISLERANDIIDKAGVIKPLDPNFNEWESEGWDNPEWGEAYYVLGEYARDEPERALVEIKKEVEVNRMKILLDPDREKALRRSLNNCVWYGRGMDYSFHHDWMKVVTHYNENIPGHLDGDDWCFSDSKNTVRRLFGYDGDGDWGYFGGVSIDEFTLETLREIYKEGQEEGNELLMPGDSLFIIGMQKVIEEGNATPSERLEMLMWAKELAGEIDPTKDNRYLIHRDYENLKNIVQAAINEERLVA